MYLKYTINTEKLPGHLEIKGPYSIGANNTIKSIIPEWERHWDNTKKVWIATNRLEYLDALLSHGMTLEKVPAKKAPPLSAPTVTMQKPTPELQQWIQRGLHTQLYPFQIEGVAFLEAQNGNGLLADEMGLGKTIQAIGYLKLHPELRPAVIICPAFLKENWCRELAIHAGLSATVGHGTAIGNQEPSADGILIVNYDLLGSRTSATTNGKRKKIPSEWFAYLSAVCPKILICDESHYIKTPSAARTIAVMELCRHTPHRIFLSGTPIENKTMDFWTVLSLLRPLEFGNRFRFGVDYCAGKRNFWGWDFSGSSNQAQLFKRTRSIMLRRKKIHVLTDLPPLQTIAVPIEITNRAEYNKAESAFISWVMENKGILAADRALRSEALVRLTYLKQLAAKGKIKASHEWIQNYLEETGKKLVVYAVHHEMLHALAQKHPNSVTIDGSSPQLARQKAVDAFQTDNKTQILFGQILAAGVGITLTSADTTLHTELAWNPSIHDQAANRVHRIGQTSNNVSAYYLIAINTLEETIMGALDRKRANITQILDGHDAPNESLLSELLQQYTQE